MANESQQYVGRAMRANRPLDLPTKHKVATGETFRYLQAHLDRGAMAHMWVSSGTVTLLDEDVTIPMPAEPVGAAGRRRQRGFERAAVAELPVIDPASGDDPAPAEVPDDSAEAGAEGGE